LPLPRGEPLRADRRLGAALLGAGVRPEPSLRRILRRRKLDSALPRPAPRALPLRDRKRPPGGAGERRRVSLLFPDRPRRGGLDGAGRASLRPRLRSGALRGRPRPRRLGGVRRLPGGLRDPGVQSLPEGRPADPRDLRIHSLARRRRDLRRLQIRQRPDVQRSGDEAAVRQAQPGAPFRERVERLVRRPRAADHRELRSVDTAPRRARRRIPRHLVRIARAASGRAGRFVLKKARSAEGTDVVVGRFASEDRWRAALDHAFADGSWIVQEYAEPRPYLYQDGESGCAIHSAVWGAFCFGNSYGGGWLRLAPRQTTGDGVINRARGAVEGILYEV